MKSNDVIDKAKAAAAVFVGQRPGTERPSPSVIHEAFVTAIPRRERTPGDDVIFRSIFNREVDRLRTQKAARERLAAS